MSCPFANTQYGGDDASDEEWGEKQYGCGCGAGAKYGGGRKRGSRSLAGGHAAAKARIMAVFSDMRRRPRARTSPAKKKKTSARPTRKLTARRTKARKYCSCLAKTAAKQSKKCLKHVAAGGNARDIPGCYNPYALCGSIKPRKLKGCSATYNFKRMPKAHVRAVAALHDKSIEELIDDATAEIRALKALDK